MDYQEDYAYNLHSNEKLIYLKKFFWAYISLITTYIFILGPYNDKKYKKMNPQLEADILYLLLDQEVVGDEVGQRDVVLKFLDKLLITVEVVGIILSENW